MIVVQKLLEMRDIRKSFGATHALSGVSIDVGSGEVLALLGENGAGKSTLINILGGIVQPDSGTISIDGTLIGSFKDVQAARRHKVAVIHQEIVLVPQLSIAENIFLGREPTTRVGLLDIDQIYRKSKEAVESLGLDLNVEDRVGGLSTAQQQLVEIVKAVFQEARILVMDEPTSSLSSPEVETLFSIVRRLRADGAAIVYISHRIDEIFEISDRVTVIRDGAFVGTRVTAETDPDELVSMMVGRHLSSSYHRSAHVIGDVLMSVEGFSKHGTF